MLFAPLAACGEAGPQPGTPEYQIQEAQRAVAARLRDPESARFSDVQIASSGAVCGKVNGKNAFGAYEGARSFLFTHSSGIDMLPSGAFIEGQEIGRPTARGWEQISFHDLYGRHCLGISAERIAADRKAFTNAIE
jgi:hypothetical protein